MADEKPIVKQKPNIVAFRYTPQEDVLLNQLKKDWQLNDFSKVLHKILATFHGIAIVRAENIARIRVDIDKWQIQHHEVFGK